MLKEVEKNVKNYQNILKKLNFLNIVVGSRELLDLLNFNLPLEKRKGIRNEI